MPIATARAAEILGLQADNPDLEGLALFLVEHGADDPTRPHHNYGGRKINGDGKQCTTEPPVSQLRPTSPA